MDARGAVIETARKRHGWKRSEFAKRLGLSYNHIYGLERGFNTAAEETLQRIADALGLDIDDVALREASGESDASTQTTSPSGAPTTHQASDKAQRERVA